MTLRTRVDLANQTEREYQFELIRKMDTINFHMMFEILQNAATRLKKGNPEDEKLNTMSFESACTAMARYLGLAPELAKDESDKPVGRMKCVACGLITSQKDCPDCGGTEFRQMEPGEMGWL